MIRPSHRFSLWAHQAQIVYIASTEYQFYIYRHFPRRPWELKATRIDIDLRLTQLEVTSCWIFVYFVLSVPDLFISNRVSAYCASTHDYAVFVKTKLARFNCYTDTVVQIVATSLVKMEQSIIFSLDQRNVLKTKLNLIQIDLCRSRDIYMQSDLERSRSKTLHPD